MPDPILLWNEVALEANRVSHSNGLGEQVGPPLSARALAIVHLAMYDALAAVENDVVNLPRYLPNPASPDAGSAHEAIAGAAHTALSRLFPGQSRSFDLILAAAGNASSAGHRFGVEVAEAILDDREGDPGVGSTSYRPSSERGRHRPDPENITQGFHAPDFGRLSKGFGITQRFELAPPPFDDNEYQSALREVRAKGIKPELMGTLPAASALRTPEESVIGLYWGYDGALNLGTPPRLYNQIVRSVAQKRANDVLANARLFAFVNVAMADAGILAWDQKYIHDFWRPVVAIREHDLSMGLAPNQAGNDLAEGCDPSWLPLGAPLSNRIGKNFTPPFPAYPSGHATFGSAALHIVRRFYNDGGTIANADLHRDTLFDGLHFVSEELNGVTTDNTGAVRPVHRRNFPDGLWQMIEENGRSRVYLGVHWVFDAFAVNNKGVPSLYRHDQGKYYGGVPLGIQIAEDVFNANGKAPKKSPVQARPISLPIAKRTPTFSSSYLK